MNEDVIKMINSRLYECEMMYNIKVLCWTMRGSIGIGIHRKNSDLDLAFLFYSLDGTCHAIHDILGYGYDFWGWDIRDAIESSILNNHSFYENDNNFKPIYLSKEHKRGGLNYFYAFYNILGNKNSMWNPFIYDTCISVLPKTFEKKVLCKFVLSPVENVIRSIEKKQKISGNDYLYTVWRILLIKHILDNGMPGEEEIDPLLEKYVDGITKNIINILRFKYRNVNSKDTIRLIDDDLNNYIVKEYKNISNQLVLEKPNYKKTSIDLLNILMEKIDDMFEEETYDKNIGKNWLL